jgi:hypothetical protein
LCQDILHEGILYNPKFANLRRLGNEDHCLYLLKVLEVLRWSSVLVYVIQKGHVSLHGRRVPYSLHRIVAGDNCFGVTLSLLDDLT